LGPETGPFSHCSSQPDSSNYLASCLRVAAGAIVGLLEQDDERGWFIGDGDRLIAAPVSFA